MYYFLRGDPREVPEDMYTIMVWQDIQGKWNWIDLSADPNSEGEFPDVFNFDHFGHDDTLQDMPQSALQRIKQLYGYDKIADKPCGTVYTAEEAAILVDSFRRYCEACRWRITDHTIIRDPDDGV